MRTFRAGNRETPELRRLASDLEQAANRADPLCALQYLTVLPAKTQDGLYLFAAGIAGASRGLYRCDAGVYLFIA